MLPIIDLRPIQLPPPDALPPAESLLPAASEGLEGGFGDILRLRVDAATPVREGGESLPVAGNALPLLPLTLTPASDGTARPAIDAIDVTAPPPQDADAADTLATLLGELGISAERTQMQTVPASTADDGAAAGQPPRTQEQGTAAGIDAELAARLAAAANGTAASAGTASGAAGTAAASTVLSPQQIAAPGRQLRPAPLLAPDTAQSVEVALQRAAAHPTADSSLFANTGSRLPDGTPPVVGPVTGAERQPPPELRDPGPMPAAAAAAAPARDEAEALARAFAGRSATLPNSAEAAMAIDAGVRVRSASTLPPLAAPSSMPPIDVPVQEAGWDRLVSERVLLMVVNGRQNAEIRLTPAELGPLKVQVSIEDGNANVSFQAQHALTRDAIEQALPRLREMLADSGLTLGQADVSDQGMNQREPGTPVGTHDANGIAEDAVDTAERTAEARRLRVADGLVDTFA